MGAKKPSKRPNTPAAIGRNVSANLRRQREHKRMSTRAVAEAMAGIGRPLAATAITKIEAGDRRVDVDDLVALAFVFDVSPVTLMLPPEPVRTSKPLAAQNPRGWPVQLTKKVSRPWELAWRWMHGEQPIGSPGADPKFIAENRPYEKEIRAEIEQFLAAREPEKPYLVTAYGPEMQAVKANIYSGEHAEYIAAELTDGLAGRRAADKADRLTYIRWELTEREAREAAREANERPDDEEARALAERLSEEAEIAGWQAARAQLAAEARGVNIAKWLEENRRFVDPKDAD